jgi:hypothetical protein
VLPKAAFPRGSPKQAAVEAVRKERRLRAEENSGQGEWGFTASGWFGGASCDGSETTLSVWP